MNFCTNYATDYVAQPCALCTKPVQMAEKLVADRKIGKFWGKPKILSNESEMIQFKRNIRINIIFMVIKIDRNLNEYCEPSLKAY